MNNPSYPPNVQFSKQTVDEQLIQNYNKQITDDEAQIQNEISVLSQLTSVLQESHNILSITKKNDGGFLSSLKFFSFKNTQSIQDHITNDEGK